MRIVVDASALIAWLLDEGEGEGNGGERVRTALLGGLLVPTVWEPEVANALVMAERRGRITADQRQHFASTVTALDIELASSPGVSRVARLAARTGLTAYDAEYLHLAADRGASLLTFDQRLADAARQEGVPLV
jgi:predicted nucleic acid-binding protein